MRCEGEMFDGTMMKGEGRWFEGDRWGVVDGRCVGEFFLCSLCCT
jgi:hypothetical protein